MRSVSRERRESRSAATESQKSDQEDVLKGLGKNTGIALEDDEEELRGDAAPCAWRKSD